MGRCVCVCACFRACVRAFLHPCVCTHLGNFYESMYIYVYGGQWSPRGVANDYNKVISMELDHFGSIGVLRGVISLGPHFEDFENYCCVTVCPWEFFGRV